MNIYLTIVKHQYSIILELDNYIDNLVVVCSVKVVTDFFEVFSFFPFNFLDSLVAWGP